MDLTIINILKEIDKHGYVAYIVGGYVRDNLLRKKSFDVDICTNARPKDLLEIFGSNVTLVEDYGAVKLTKGKYNIDITTFRREEKYVNGKPKGIEYVSSLEEDLKNKIIKTVGKPEVRFKEDPSRILRALRFSVTLNFKLDKDIINYIYNNKEEIEKINYNKKKYELDKIFLSKNIFDFVKIIKKFDIEKELGIKINKIKPLKSLVGMWAQIEFNDKYPFTKIELEQINKIKELVKKGKIDKYDVYKYGSYITVNAGNILGKSTKKINKLYDKLPIKDIIDIDITAEEICNILNIEPSKELGNVYKIIEKEIIDYKLINNKENIIKRLEKLKGESNEGNKGTIKA